MNINEVYNNLIELEHPLWAAKQEVDGLVEATELINRDEYKDAYENVKHYMPEFPYDEIDDTNEGHAKILIIIAIQDRKLDIIKRFETCLKQRKQS